MGLQLSFMHSTKNKYLSVLKNAGENSISYYVGNDLADVSHLKKCTLICRTDFSPKLPDVVLVQVANPQLHFYKLSSDYKEDYLDNDGLKYNKHFNAYIHRNCQIGENVSIGAGSVIGNCIIDDHVEIQSNVVIYAKSHIQEHTVIQSSTTIGAKGYLWVWDADKRVYLEQLGSVIVGPGVQIGSQCTVVRGSVNESTIVGEGTCMAHGSFLGHGNVLGNYNHLANGVVLGGGCSISNRCFLGSGVTMKAGVGLIADNIVLGTGAVVTKNLTESGVYVGCPARKIKEVTESLSGVPFGRRG